jgi:hypothetical protein
VTVMYATVTAIVIRITLVSASHRHVSTRP